MNVLVTPEATKKLNPKEPQMQPMVKFMSPHQ